MFKEYISHYGYKIYKHRNIIIHEHRQLIEIFLGRPLKSSEIVHHKNHNRLDNRIENLEVMTKAEHNRHHFFTNKDRVKDWNNRIMQEGRDCKLKPITNRPKTSKPNIVWREYKVVNGKRQNRAYVTRKCKYCYKIFWTYLTYKSKTGLCINCTGKKVGLLSHGKTLNLS